MVLQILFKKKNPLPFRQQDSFKTSYWELRAFLSVFVNRSTEWLRWEGTSGCSDPTPPVYARMPRAGCPGPCPGGFWISQGGRLHNLFGQPVPALGRLHSEKVFPDFQITASHVPLCAHCPLFCYWAPLGRACFGTLPVFTAIYKITLSFLFKLK